MPPPCCHKPTDPKTCHLCKLYETREDYRSQWDAQYHNCQPPTVRNVPTPEVATPDSGAGRCIYLGSSQPVNGRRVDRRGKPCNCAGKFVRKCELYGECTVIEPRHDTACCRNCLSRVPESSPPDYSPPDVGATRHLLYHVWPVRGNGIWQKNISALLHRISLFNGVRAVAVVTDGKSDPFDAVAERLAPYVDHIAEFPNDPGLREVATWDWLWSHIPRGTDSPGPTGEDAIFYCHAKGVHRDDGPWIGTFYWPEILYHTCLDYWPLAKKLLTLFPTVGSAKKDGCIFHMRDHGEAEFRAKDTFHYSGSFYWVRKSFATAERVAAVPRYWTGVEPWPGMWIEPEEAGCLYLHGGQNVDFYNANFAKRAWREFLQWREANKLHLSIPNPPDRRNGGSSRSTTGSSVASSAAT